MVIKTGKQLGGGTTTAQSWMTLAGSITDTGVMKIPKNENEFRFQVRSARTELFENCYTSDFPLALIS